VLSQYTPIELDETAKAVEPRNAFMMSHLLQEVARSGTAARATQVLKRPDIYGKTGTTNDSMDAWFAGYQPTLAAVTWIGYDTPKKLGDKETGGGLALPVWISFMQKALQNVPIAEIPAPEGVIKDGADWFYQEFTRSTGVVSLGLGGNSDGAFNGSGGTGGMSGMNGTSSSSNASGPSYPNSSTSSGSANGENTSNEEKKRIMDIFKN
jgi:penicillin-binding protein 1A